MEQCFLAVVVTPAEHCLLDKEILCCVLSGNLDAATGLFRFPESHNCSPLEVRKADGMPKYALGVSLSLKGLQPSRVEKLRCVHRKSVQMCWFESGSILRIPNETRGPAAFSGNARPDNKGG